MRTVARVVAIAMLVVAGLVHTGAPPAHAVGSFRNESVADIALRYNGQWGGNACRDAGKSRTGQCKQFVNCVVVLAGGAYAGDGKPDYAESFIRAGGKEIGINSTRKGDIIQWGSESNSPHTAIVVAHLGGNSFDVVDSNWNSDEIVRRHTITNIYDRKSAPRFIRMGTVSDPFGALDVAKAVGPGTIYVRGWAADPQLKSGPIKVHVYADGSFVTELTANKYRPDVPKVFAGYGSYLGYSATLKLKLRGGTKNICVYAINVGIGQNAPVGCSSVTVPDANPIGAFDTSTSELGDFTWRGWAVDPNKPAGPAVVSVWVNGQYAGWGYANKQRTDVAAAYPGYGQYLGYNFRHAYPSGGNIQVCVKTPNWGAGVPGNTTLGCKNIYVRTKAYYYGHIVQWSGDTKTQKTSWYVTGSGTRRWIPSSTVYWCLRNHGAPAPNVLSSRALDQLTDETGVRATCS